MIKRFISKSQVYLRKQQKREIYICFFLFFIPFIIMFSILTINESEKSREIYTESREELNKQLQVSFDNILMSINKVSYFHMSDVQVEKILLREYESKGIQYVEDTIYMNRAVDTLLQMNPLFYDITFISKNGEIFGRVNTTNENESYIYEEIRQLDERGINSYVYPKTVRNVMFQEKELFSCLTRLIDYEKNTVGYLLVDIDFRDIQEIINSTDSSQSRILLAGTDSILASNYKQDLVGEKIYERLDKEKLKEQESFQQMIYLDGHMYTCLVQSIDSIQANIIQYYESPSYFVEFLKTQGLAFLFCLILMLLVLVVVNRNSKKVVIPIELLIAGMKETGKGNFKQIETSSNIYEIHMIIEKYNQMIEQLEKAVKDNYISQINQKNIELKMLQSQINPHFIYNTLNLISSMAILNGVEDISYISDKLSSLLRYNIKERDIVFLYEELQQVENYLYIQSVRFSNKIQIAIEVDEDLKECQILKFLIQPLVENCIFHGLELQCTQGKIEIVIQRFERDMLIRVEDNGVGISKDKLLELQNIIKEKPSFGISMKKEISIGIKNVASRIKTFYGEKYGLTIESREGEGTAFSMRLPIRYAEEGERQHESHDSR